MRKPNFFVFTRLTAENAVGRVGMLVEKAKGVII